jgi:hypothetical protein
MRRLALTLGLIALIVAPHAGANPNGCRRLYFHRTQMNAIGAGWYDLDTNAASGLGSTFDTLITNTTAGGTSITMTKTGGGQVINGFITKPLSASFSVAASAITTSLYGLEAATGNNAGFRTGLYRATCSTGANLATIIDPTTVSTEWGTTVAARTSAGTPSATTINAGECLKVVLYVFNVGTMGAGTPGVTVRFDDPANTTNTSFIDLATGACMDVTSWGTNDSQMTGVSG